MFRRGPTAKASRLLKELDLGSNSQANNIRRTWYFARATLSNDDSRWVDAKDELSPSLLQAQLIDLKLRSKLRKEFEGPT